MNNRTRSLTVCAGLSLLFAAFLLLVAKPFPHLAPVLPYASTSHNLPYFAYLRLMQILFGLHAGVIMAANGLLVMATGWLVFRAGAGLSDPHHRILGGSVAMLTFLLNPLAIVLPLTLGFLGGHLWVPLLLLLFINIMLAVDHWSAFMRAIVLALAWSLFLWVHLPTALVVLIAMVPWVFYNRRPMVALWTFVTVVLLGTLLFSVFWCIGCALVQRWSMLEQPVHTLQSMGSYLQQGLTSAGTPDVFKERMVHIAGWLSPFLLIFGFWVSIRALIQMFKERRASASNLAALIAIVVLGVVWISPGKDTLPGAWYLVMVAAVWSPLIAKEIACKENVFTRASRLTFAVGVAACSGVLWILRGDVSAGSLIPNGLAIVKLVAAVAAIGVGSVFVLRRHTLAWEHRAQALLAGATLAYFVMMDVWLLR